MAAFAASLASAIAGAEELPSPPYPGHQDLTYFLDASGQQQPIRTAADWAIS